MARLDVWTYKDAIDHALDYLGAASDAQAMRFARKAIQLALQELSNKRNWVYFYQMGHINTVASYATGQITYLQTSGGVPRQVTLTGGTWPSWAAQGMLGIGLVPYPVSNLISSTVLQLSAQNNPGADITTPMAYNLYQDAYTLPIDFGAMGEIIVAGFARILRYMVPGQFLELQRVQIAPAVPYFYTFTGAPHLYGAMSVRFYPPPDATYAMNFTYRRRPRAMTVDFYETGTISTTAGITTITGNGTSWTGNLVGCAIRLAQDAQSTPTGVGGANPYYVERSVISVTDANHLVVDTDPGVTLAGVSHSISDPIDIEPGAMLTYFLREVERQMRIIRRIKSTPDEEKQHMQSLNSAFEADARHYESRSTFSNTGSLVRLAQMPKGADQT